VTGQHPLPTKSDKDPQLNVNVEPYAHVQLEGTGLIVGTFNI
jgi:hypothetical protein